VECGDVVDREVDRAAVVALAADAGEIVGGEQIGRLVAAEGDEAVLVEIGRWSWARRSA
jgi:hypothetical protein